jgi:RNA polymerase sigma-70 factor (ECF subfamily)
MQHLSPQQIIGGFKRKEEKAFTWIYHTYYNRVLNDILYLTNDSSDAEDLTADVFTKLLQYNGPLETINKISFFIFQTTKNICLNYTRHQNIVASKATEIEDYFNKINKQEQQSEESNSYFENLVYNAIENLPAKTRKIFKLHYFDELTNAEIANRVKLSEKTVANLKNRAKIFLQIEIQKRRHLQLRPLIFFL